MKKYVKRFDWWDARGVLPNDAPSGVAFGLLLAVIVDNGKAKKYWYDASPYHRDKVRAISRHSKWKALNWVKKRCTLLST